MALLGPAPAAAIGVARTARRRVRVSPALASATLNNLVVWATFPIVGGAPHRRLGGRAVPGSGERDRASPALVLVRVHDHEPPQLRRWSPASQPPPAGRSSSGQPPLRSTSPCSRRVRDGPAHRRCRLQSTSASASERSGSSPSCCSSSSTCSGPASRPTSAASSCSSGRSELASLQVGLINTVLQTLSMRDAMTARHSAAVARYAREVAALLGLSEREQELIHTAGLFHDIGKFIFPDSILVADRKLTDDEWEIVKLHPEQGAKLVRRIEGYGPVADIVLSHHERIDGTRLPVRPQRRAHPARLAHPRGRRHLRRDDRARLLPRPGQLGGGACRAPARRRHAARPDGGRRRSSR